MQELLEIVVGIVAIFIIYVVFLYKTDPTKSWLLLSKVAAVPIALIIFSAALYLYRKKRWVELLKRIGTTELKNEILNFIHRFGNEKTKDWCNRSYCFDNDRLLDFVKILNRKGLKIDENILRDVLRHYIEQEEFSVTSESILTKPQNLNTLSGSDFEDLLKRLFTAMGYHVQKIGRAGDQGGDLIANKGGKRFLVQAKRYTGSVPNAAVQQAFTAKTHYDCTAAVVATTGEFTREAREVAKTTQVQLVGRKELQQKLMEFLKENWS